MIDLPHCVCPPPSAEGPGDTLSNYFSLTNIFLSFVERKRVKGGKSKKLTLNYRLSLD